MSENVKFIFKTLLKIPIIVLVVYAVFNVFAFSLSYFKILGFSYVAMQTAVENNYIPDEESKTLDTYLRSMETYMLENCTLTCDTDITSGSNENKKVQYGTPIKVTVSAHYRFIWPLMPAEQRTGAAVEGMNGQNTGSELTDDQLEEARQAYENNAKNNIVIEYTVPGLKYYPDLS